MRPRVHGNGFIQLALTDDVRLHVWPDHTYPIKKQKVATGIHTHRFSYRSRVISGELVHLTYRFHKSTDVSVGIPPAHKPPPTHRLYTPGVDERLRPTEHVGTLSILDQLILKPGDEYTFGAGKFHATLPVADLSVTLMEKLAVGTIPVHVVCRIDEEPDNDFDRDADNSEAFLWGIIIEALGRAK